MLILTALLCNCSLYLPASKDNKMNDTMLIVVECKSERQIESSALMALRTYRFNDLEKQNDGITFFTRSDKYPVGKRLIRGDRSLNLNLQTELLANEHHQFILNTTFRKLKILDGASKQKADETILGRAEYIVNERKGLLQGNILYELGTGLN